MEDPGASCLPPHRGRARGKTSPGDHDGAALNQSVGQHEGMDVLDVTGSTVIVTGASSGIGAATARLLHKAGAHPVLAARRADRLAVLSEELDGALAVPTDVTDPTAVRRLVETTLDRHGRIDGLVNNAGVSLHSPLDRLDLDEFARRELEADGIAVSLVLPSITATEFGGGRYQPGEQPRPGVVAHSAEYVGKVVLRALRTGEERIDIPHGPEQPELTEIPDSP